MFLIKDNNPFDVYAQFGALRPQYFGPIPWTTGNLGFFPILDVMRCTSNSDLSISSVKAVVLSDSQDYAGHRPTPILPHTCLGSDTEASANPEAQANFD
jgi:hypothetical protein